MGKIKYLIKRLFNMNFKQMFEIIDKVSKKTGKNKYIIFLDIIICGIKYQAGYMDYNLFEMYNLNPKQRKTIITRGINNSLVKKYNNLEYIKYFNNKLLFNKKFNKYLSREWLELTTENFDEFEKFTKRHKEIIVKPLDQACGKGIEKIKVNKDNIKEVYSNLLETKRTLIEEVAVQCKEISNLHPSSINTMRIVTLNKQIVAAYLRIGNNGNVVDNFNHDGLAAPINIETGVIDYVAIDKKGNLYDKHPITNENILNFKLPKWEQVKEFVIKASHEIPEMGYVGWDVCLGKDTPFLIEANEFPGHDIYQLPPHRKDGIGMLPKFKEATAKSTN